MWFLQLEIPFFSSKRLFPLSLPGTYFERGHYSKLIPDLLPHWGSGVLSSPSPFLSLLSVSNGASSMTSILIPSNTCHLSLWILLPGLSGSFTYLWNYLVPSLTRKFHSFLPSAHFALPGTMPATSHTTHICSVNWTWADFSLPGTLGVSELQLGKRLLTEENFSTQTISHLHSGPAQISLTLQSTKNRGRGVDE